MTKLRNGSGMSRKELREALGQGPVAVNLQCIPHASRRQKQKSPSQWTGFFAISGGLGRNRTTSFAGHSGEFLEQLLQIAPETLKFLSVWPFNHAPP